MERGIRQGRPVFVLVPCLSSGPLVQKWCDQGFCVDIEASLWQLGLLQMTFFWQLEPPGN